MSVRIPNPVGLSPAGVRAAWCDWRAGKAADLATTGRLLATIDELQGEIRMQAGRMLDAGIVQASVEQLGGRS